MLEPYYTDDLVTLYHADCRDHPDVLATADVMVTDPPYGYGYRAGGSRVGGNIAPYRGFEIANDRDTTARDDVLAEWGERPALMFGSWKRPRPSRKMRELLVWDKGGSPGSGDLSLPWGSSHEEIYVMGDGYAGRRGPTVLLYPPKRSRSMAELAEHPNEKPIPLMRALIEKCPPGTIIDPFMGSGSTLVACQQLGRKCIGFDVDEKWCRVARDRLAQAPLFAG